MKELYIIGNGFDLRHGLPTKYENFKDWLSTNSPMTSYSLETMFNNNGDLWSNFEEALGCYNPEEAINGFFDPIIMERLYPQGSEVVSLIHSLSYDEICSLFCGWIRSINIEGVRSLIKFSSDALFLTFNYTKVLEEIYRIPETRICHIHGYADDPDSIIFGHNNWIDISRIIGSQKGSREWICQSNRLFELNLLYKDTQTIISNTMFFNLLENLDVIYVLGHSLNSVDALYFQTIIHQNPEAKWIIDYNPRYPEEEHQKITTLTKWGVAVVTSLN